MVIEPGNMSPNNTSGAVKSRTNAPAAPVSKREKADAQGGEPKAPDNVSLSTAGQNLAKLEAELAKAPDVDDAKVAEVRASLANGSYSINADRIAENMLDQDSVL